MKPRVPIPIHLYKVACELAYDISSTEKVHNNHNHTLIGSYEIKNTVQLQNASIAFIFYCSLNVNGCY